MKTAIFEYDDSQVCECCGTNDHIHYNVFVRHGDSYCEADPDLHVWCNQCECDASMIDPESYEERS